MKMFLFKMAGIARLTVVLIILSTSFAVLPVSAAAPRNGQNINFQQTAPILTITKTADKATINTGEPMGFTITVTNTGSAVATAVKVTDTLPGSLLPTWKISPAVTGCSIRLRVLTCSFGDLPAGASRTVHILSGNVPNQCTLYANTATASAGNLASVEATATVEALCPDLVVSAAPVTSPIYSGQEAAFTVTVTNTGLGAAKNVRLVNTLPTVVKWKASTTLCKKILSDFVCNLGTLAAGASVTVTFRATIPTSGCGTLQDDALVTATNEPGGTEGNTTLAVVEIHCPELALGVSADAASVSAGDVIGYTIQVDNTGVGTSYKLVLSDTLPAASGLAWTMNQPAAGCSLSVNVLTCTLSQLAGGTGFAVHLTSPTTVESCGIYTNTAELKDQFEDPISASADIEVTCPAAVP